MCQNKELNEKSPTFLFFSTRVDRHTCGGRRSFSWSSPPECVAFATRMHGNRDMNAWQSPQNMNSHGFFEESTSLPPCLTGEEIIISPDSPNRFVARQRNISGINIYTKAMPH